MFIKGAKPTDQKPTQTDRNRLRLRLTYTRVGTRFGFSTMSGLGINRENTKKTEKTDRINRHKQTYTRVGTRLGFSTMSVSGWVGIRTGRVGFGQMLKLFTVQLF